MKRTLSVFLLTTSLLFCAGELAHRRAPGFSLMDAASQQHDLYDYRGQYLVVDFMKVDCPHCAKFSDVLEQTMAKYRGKVHALSIVVPPYSGETVREYIRQHNITIPVLADCGQVAASYLQQGPTNPRIFLPHAFLVDPSGMIVNDWAYGAGHDDIFEGDALSKELDRLLGGKK
jgi:peroxiredoxin